jgi:hypothetical protein
VGVVAGDEAPVVRLTPSQVPSVEDGAVGPSGVTASPESTPVRRLPPPGILELEELLSSHLNTRVKVDLSSKRGKVVVEFATLEDLERIYKMMVGGPTA